MGGVEDEPLAEFEHCSQKVHVLLVGQLEVLRTDRSALVEGLCQRNPAQDVPHLYIMIRVDRHSNEIKRKTGMEEEGGLMAVGKEKDGLTGCWIGVERDDVMESAVC